MREFFEAFAVILLALNAPATLHLWRRTTANAPGRDAAVAGLVATAAAGAILLAFAVTGKPILDVLDVSIATFQVGTAFLLILGSLPAFVPSFDGWDRSNGQLKWPAVRLGLALGSPAAVAAIIMYSADFGAGTTLFAAAAALILSGAILGIGRARRTVPEALLVWIGRAFAASLVVVAAGLIREGVERV